MGTMNSLSVDGDWDYGPAIVPQITQCMGEQQSKQSRTSILSKCTMMSTPCSLIY